MLLNFPGGAVGDNPPAIGPVRSRSGKAPHAAEQLKPVYHNYWAHALESMSHNYQSPCAPEPAPHKYTVDLLQLLKPNA